MAGQQLILSATVEFLQHSLKSSQKKTVRYSYGKDFSDCYNHNKGSIDAEASYKVFSASAQASWDIVTKATASSESAEYSSVEESVTFQDGFLQIFRVVSTTIKIGNSTASHTETVFVDSVPSSRPLEALELKKRATEYLQTHYQGSTITGLTARWTKTLPEPRKYVKEVQCKTFDRQNTPDGMVRCKNGGVADINKGFKGKFSYVVATWTTDVAEAATGFNFVCSKQGLPNHGGDYAAGAGGDHRYIVTLRNGPGAPIPWKCLALNRGKHTKNNLVSSTGDLNKGRGGDDLFLYWWSSPKVPQIG